MAYASWSVTFGEQPSAAKWNILGTNDASFNDGSGIGTNAIGAASLATNAIKLGYAAITSTFTTSSTSFVQVTGLTSTVTVPAGGRSVKITVYAIDAYQGGSGGAHQVSIWDGTVGSGTQLQTVGIRNGTNDGSVVTLTAVVTPAAGSKTYNVGYKVGTSTGNLEASSAYPAFILVELI